MRRVRLRLAGALLLTTLLLSFAEAAWAATCDPAMAEMQQSDMGGMAEMQGMAAGPGGQECTPGTGHAHDPIGDTDTECPFGPAGGFGCAVAAWLPAVATRVNEPAPTSVLRHGATAFLAHDPRTHAIFHPPKA